MENFDKPRNKPISSDINTKNFVVDSLAIGKSSYDISRETGYPASTIRSFHKNNKQQVKEREKELDAMAPDIIADLQFKTKTSLELSMHKYRPDIFPNDTGYKDNKDIIAFQGNLIKPHQKVLEKKGILDSHAFNQINLLNQDNRQQTQIISPKVLDLFGEHAKSLIDNGEDEVEENSQDS
jgi:hypothetical protein